MKTLTFGLVGEKGSGKTTFTEVLKEEFGEKNVLVLSSGDILRALLKKMGRQETDENAQDLYLELRKKRGEAFLAEEIGKQIERNIGTYPCIVWDGVRKPWDFRTIRICGGISICITADERKRWLRRRRGKRGKAGERGLTWEQFRKEEEKETEQDIKRIGKNCDFCFKNNDRTRDFKKLIKKFLKEENFAQE